MFRMPIFTWNIMTPAATYTHVENGVTFVDGCDPGHGRVVLAYPGPG